MRAIDTDRYERAIVAVGLKSKFIRELRPRFTDLSNWEDREFLPITDRSGNVGVLWIELNDKIYIIPFSLSRGIIDKTSGQARSVICDLCFTQHIGTAAARLTVAMPGRYGASRSLLSCGDLACSAHVRGHTPASLKSKAQLRETITNEDKVARLRHRLSDLVHSLEVQAVL